jgi:hypothetical protein
VVSEGRTIFSILVEIGPGSVGRATRKAGAEPLATPVGEIDLGAVEVRFCRVLLDAMCSRETVPGSERRTSNEWVAVKEEFWRCREFLEFPGGGAADGSTRCRENNGGWVNDDVGPGYTPRCVGCERGGE